jgi:hypothetical protein
MLHLLQSPTSHANSLLARHCLVSRWEAPSADAFWLVTIETSCSSLVEKEAVFIDVLCPFHCRTAVSRLRNGIKDLSREEYYYTQRDVNVNV